LFKQNAILIKTVRIYFDPCKRGEIVTQAGFWYKVLSALIQFSKRDEVVRIKITGLEG
jgi:hypothetical protein